MIPLKPENVSTSRQPGKAWDLDRADPQPTSDVLQLGFVVYSSAGDDKELLKIYSFLILVNTNC